MVLPNYLFNPQIYEINREPHYPIFLSKDEKEINSGWRIAYYDNAIEAPDDFCDSSSFDKEFVLRYLKEYYTNNNYEIGSESSLDSDVSILLKSYYSDDDKNPEENTNCPLARLNLLDSCDKKTFKKISPTGIK